MSENNEQVNHVLTIPRGLKLLRKASNQTAYLKAGIMGFAGSGKTFTAAEIAIGLANDVGNKKPVAFFDTETGSDFLIKRFEESGVEFFVVKTKSFKDLLDFMKEAEQVCSVAIIDSISHVWQDLLDSYARKLNRTSLLFQDWATIKSEWRQFTDIYVNAKVHTILCGRAGYEYDFETNEAGKKELIKTGTKMKAETEMGYEPSLLMEMTRIKKSETSGNVMDKGWIHRCFILKDRTNTMNGKEIDFPRYVDFKPVINFLNIGGEHVGIDTTRNSEDLFQSPDRSFSEKQKQKDILLEQLNEILILNGLDGTSTEAKKARTQLLVDFFGTSSKTFIENLSVEKIKEAVEKIRLKFVSTVEQKQQEEPKAA